MLGAVSPGDWEYEVAVVGAGPAGSVLASLLGLAGRSVVVLERDHHPRHHVGESLTPASNFIWERIGFLEKMERAGFTHKPGAAWTAPRSPVGRCARIWLNEFPAPGNPRPYTFQIEREVFDEMLARHARECGAEVREGVRVEEVLMRDGRAVGVRAEDESGRSEEIRARVVVDASGRRCLLATQLGLRTNDPAFSQFAVYSWFENVKPPPPDTDGMILLHFLDLQRAWAWQIPLRDGRWSVGFVTDRRDFKKSGTSIEDWAAGLVHRNVSLEHNLSEAVRVQPWRTEADYSYKISQVAGPGWLLVGDALRFVDPVFSTGVDVASYSAQYAFEAIEAVLAGAGEAATFASFERTVLDGVDAWYDIISLFYRIQNLFTFLALRPETRKAVVRILQGNPYDADALRRAREMIELMERSYERVMANPRSLLRPGALAALASAGR
jgi:1H-pyrrole-2-carbonyl-[peptidyl-carrier protein] chlorinase